MLDLLLIAGFVFAAGVIYFCTKKLTDKLDPYYAENETESRSVYNIAVQDMLFLQEMERFLDQTKCTFYTGSREEILSDCSVRRMDAVILSDGTIEPEESLLMNRLVGKYYSSVLSIKTDTADLKVLSQKPHSVTIFYQNSFRGILDSMISQGVLVVE